MPQFAYEARAEDGSVTGGVLEADSLKDAGERLSQRNIFVVRLAAHRDRSVRRSTAFPHANRSQVSWFMTQLSVMVETGMRLCDALECLARQSSHAPLRALLSHISTHVQEGCSLSDAMARHQGSFPPTLVALIRASEQNGTLSRVLRRAAGYLMDDLRALRRIRAALMYPAFMCLLAGAVTVFLLTVILPRFAAVFEHRGAVLPAPTRILMNLSDSLIHNWMAFTAGLVLIVCITNLFMRTNLAKRGRDYVVVTAPVLSTLFNNLYHARTFRAMAVLIESGVPLLDGMQHVQGALSNSYHRMLWKEVSASIQRGERLSGPLFSSSLVAEPIAQMIDCGDRSGRLQLVFSHLADLKEDEYDQSLKLITQMIEPIMILIMGSIVGFIAAALMLPLFAASRIVA